MLEFKSFFELDDTLTGLDVGLRPTFELELSTSKLGLGSLSLLGSEVTLSGTQLFLEYLLP